MIREKNRHPLFVLFLNREGGHGCFVKKKAEKIESNQRQSRRMSSKGMRGQGIEWQIQSENDQ